MLILRIQSGITWIVVAQSSETRDTCTKIWIYQELTTQVSTSIELQTTSTT